MSARRCPICSKELTEQADYFPFCSERCKRLDLGAWAAERYRIAGKPLNQDPDRPDEQNDEIESKKFSH